jgi:hypothetical protein
MMTAGTDLVQASDRLDMISAPLKRDELYLERLRKAARMSFAEKFLAGERLFASACEWTKLGIRSDHPDATDDEVLQLLRSRLRLAERLDRLQRERHRET